MGVNVAAHTRHIFLGSVPPRGKEYTFFIFTRCESLKRLLLSKFPGFIFKPNRLVKMTKLFSDLK